MGTKYPDYCSVASFLFEKGITEFGVDFSQFADQSVANKWRRIEAAFSEARRFEIFDSVLDRCHNAVRKPDSRTRLKRPGKRFRQLAFAPPPRLE